jgi:hypothetical protein
VLKHLDFRQVKKDTKCNKVSSHFEQQKSEPTENTSQIMISTVICLGLQDCVVVVVVTQ